MMAGSNGLAECTTFTSRVLSPTLCTGLLKRSFSAAGENCSLRSCSRTSDTACRSSRGKSEFFGSPWCLDQRTPEIFSHSILTRRMTMVPTKSSISEVSKQEGGRELVAFGWAFSHRVQVRDISTALAMVPLMRKLLAGFVKPYLEKNPTAAVALELIRKEDGGPVCYDHFAFRTFGVDGCGIDSIAQVFLDLGYETRDELRFPAKKLRALWFAPPEHLYDVDGQLENGPVPRIFISELLVDQLSEESQSVIHKYTTAAAKYAKHASTASVLNTLTWPVPTFADYQQLASESEYAAWTLVNGYSLNHATVSVHRLARMRNINELNQFLQENGIKLNSEGGILKVSPDGGLQQSSSVADSLQYAFADGEVKTVAASYIEFAERLVLPIYSSLKTQEVHERHRREGFEVGNADKIFESTSSDQIGKQRV